jgi:hypothetical protein
MTNSVEESKEKQVAPNLKFDRQESKIKVLRYSFLGVASNFLLIFDMFSDELKVVKSTYHVGIEANALHCQIWNGEHEATVS